MIMSENDIGKAGQTLDEGQVAEIAGGNCTLSDVMKITSDLKESYDNLVDFTSYVIERVLGK